MKNITRILLALLVGVSAYAQISVKVGAGFGIPTAGSYVTAVKNGSTYDIKFGTFGKGIYPEVGVWYGLNDFLFVGLDLNYLLGLKTQFTNTDNFDNEEYGSSMIQILPGVQFRAGDDGVIPYGTFQPIIGVGGKATFYGTESANNVTVTRDVEYSGGTALGFKTGAGLLFDLGGLNFFTELGVYTLSWMPKTMKVTQTTEIAGVTNTDSETYSIVSKGYDPNSNTQIAADKFPFNSVVVKVGVTFGGN